MLQVGDEAPDFELRNQHGESVRLSDFWPHGEVARAYEVFLEEPGFATRGTFLVDTAGVVRWSVVTGPGEARSTDDYRAALTGLLDPADWDAQRAARV